MIEPIIKGEIKTPCHLYSGQEAVAVGVCANLDKSDYVFGNHRSHGHYLAKGGDMKEMIAEIFCKESGCSKGKGGSMHLISKECGFLGSAPIVSGTISLATGAALAVKIKKEKRVVLSFFGDGSTNEGTLYESLNFASIKNLPIIFTCENNLYSTHMPISAIRPNKPIFEVAKPFGIASHQVDGNDVLEVYKTAKKAVELCRKGKGPVFIEFLTYRLRGHVGPDDNIQGEHTDIRPKAEIEKWRKRDPILKLEKYLLAKKIVNKKEIEDIKRSVEDEVAGAHKFAQTSRWPQEGELNNYVFGK